MSNKESNFDYITKSGLGAMLIWNPSFRFEHGVYASFLDCTKPQRDLIEWAMMAYFWSFLHDIFTYATYIFFTTLHVAVNDAIRRIFSHNRWESIRMLRESFAYQSLTENFAERKSSSEYKLSCFVTDFSHLFLKSDCLLLSLY